MLDQDCVVFFKTTMLFQMFFQLLPATVLSLNFDIVHFEHLDNVEWTAEFIILYLLHYVYDIV